MICESHHKDDIEDFSKYKVKRCMEIQKMKK